MMLAAYKIRLVLMQYWTYWDVQSMQTFFPWKSEVHEECQKAYQSNVVKSIFYSVSKWKFQDSSVKECVK